MRAKEFTINIPINIKINGNGEPEIDMPGQEEPDASELQDNPILISPLQQDLELRKAELGKRSPSIDKMLKQDTIGAEQAKPAQPNTIKKLINRQQ